LHAVRSTQASDLLLRNLPIPTAAAKPTGIQLTRRVVIAENAELSLFCDQNREDDVDATHFRQRAARAREMAQSGDDIRLSRMLLEVAVDLDAEADAIESSHAADRRRFPRLRSSDTAAGLLHRVDADDDVIPVHVINLSIGGARFRVDRVPPPGSKVTLELPVHGISLDGTILRARGTDAAMLFDSAASADPILRGLLRSDALADPIQA
jgi:hypothetical protein